MATTATTQRNTPDAYKATWKHIRPAQIGLVKSEVAKARPLVDALRAKLVASLTTEQRQAFNAITNMQLTDSYVFPERDMESLRDGLRAAGNVYTLESVLEQVNTVRALLAGQKGGE